jgi:hypothetical protein
MANLYFENIEYLVNISGITVFPDVYILCKYFRSIKKIFLDIGTYSFDKKY